MLKGRPPACSRQWSSGSGAVEGSRAMPALHVKPQWPTSSAAGCSAAPCTWHHAFAEAFRPSLLHLVLSPALPSLPSCPCPQLCVLGDHKHCEEAKALGLDAMTVDDLKKLNKNKKLVKKLGEWQAGGRGGGKGGDACWGARREGHQLCAADALCILCGSKRGCICKGSTCSTCVSGCRHARSTAGPAATLAAALPLLSSRLGPPTWLPAPASQLACSLILPPLLPCPQPRSTPPSWPPTL